MTRNAAIVGLVLLLSPIAAGCARQEPPDQAVACPPTSTRGVSSPQPLSATAHGYHQLKLIDDSLQTMARPWEESYAGHEIDPDGGRVLLWRKPSREFDEAISTIPQGDRITVICAPYSASELRRFTYDLLATAKGGLGNEDPFAAWARHDGTCVQVEAKNLEPVRRELTQRHPTAPICFVQAG